MIPFTQPSLFFWFASCLCWVNKTEGPHEARLFMIIRCHTHPTIEAAISVCYFIIYINNST